MNIPCCQSTSPGIGLVWAESPPGPDAPAGDDPSLAEQRWAALWQARDTGPGEAQGAWREATLVGPCRDAARWDETMVSLRQANPEILLRVEEAWEGSVESPVPVEMLAARRPLFVHGAIQRPERLTGNLARRLRAMLRAGLPLAAEIYLQRGVNDDIDLLRELCLALNRHGVRPYYLVDGEWMEPETRVPEDRTEELVRGLRGWISGLAVPQWIVEGREGMRRPKVPDYLDGLDDEGARGSNYQGQRFAYPNPPTPLPGRPSRDDDPS